MEKDEHDKAVDDFFTKNPRYRTKNEFAKLVRAAHANGMFEANACYQLAGLAPSHIGMIEVSSRAHALRRRNAQ